jgi:ABC-type polysaccharide/polyol phosphate transport system ATPase subunit
MGLNGDATGIENIYILGYLRGFTKEEIDKKIDRIIQFSELEDFINLPINTYSSGMKIRLVSSIALEIDPKILLIDEFFGAGDTSFMEKSRKALKEKINNIESIIFASHNKNLVESICNRMIVMDKGEIKDDKYLTR